MTMREKIPRGKKVLLHCGYPLPVDYLTSDARRYGDADGYRGSSVGKDVTLRTFSLLTHKRTDEMMEPGKKINIDYMGENVSSVYLFPA